MTKTTTPHLATLLQNAVKLHQTGNLSDANRIYQQILEVDPHHFEALHFSGVVAKQNGDPSTAIQLISAALESVRNTLNAGHASALCNLGASYQDCLMPERALNSYQQAIQLKPDYAMAHNNLGNALKNLIRYQEALIAYRTAITLTPNYAEAFYNCALTLHQLEQFEEAVRHFERALSARPHYAEAFCARGVSLHALGDDELAIDSYNQAIACHANYPEACFNRGISYNRLRRFDAAVASFELAIAYRPNYAQAYFYLGNSLRHLHNTQAAIKAYQRARELGADQRQIDFVLATLGIGTIPEAPPTHYIQQLFDQYADHFDAHLTEVLHYAIPQLIDQTINRHRSQESLAVIDLGCGTGLCAPFLRPYARQLTGIDLSQNMLRQAARLNLYDHLIAAEITDFLFRHDQPADVIVAADVLVYIGNLTAVMTGAAKVLAAHGLFCFSVEDSQVPDSDYVLQQSNRYAHSETCLRRLAAESGLHVLEINRHSGRQENQRDIPSLIVLLQKVSVGK